MELSIIMINYNTPELTAQAVESILKTTHQVSYEILVMDNSSERDKEYRPEALPAPVKVFTALKTKASATPAIWALKRRRDQSFCF